MTREEAIKEIVGELKASLLIFGEKNDKERQDAFIMAIEALKEQRPHGKWITTSNPNYSPFDNTSEFICICSKCTYSSGDRITAYWNFCPNCGADMRKEGDTSVTT